MTFVTSENRFQFEYCPHLHRLVWVLRYCGEKRYWSTVRCMDKDEQACRGVACPLIRQGNGHPDPDASGSA